MQVRLSSLYVAHWCLQPKEDPAAIANITAVLLSCLQAIPLHEATHNVPISLGPPWMNKAKDLLLMLLPSASTIVRRGAAEGLALLATLGVTEDAHFLQSTLLQNLDEVMQGNKPDGKARALALEPVSAARAGSLHTLACIQRTAHNVAVRKRTRARGRMTGSKTEEAVEKTNEELPVLHMLTRILPSAACHEFRDYFVVRTYALHSFALLLTYSKRLHSSELGPEELQLVIKGIELADNNFTESWAVASVDIDRGQEPEKLASEIAFLAVLVRLMTMLLPFISELQSTYRNTPKRFSLMVTLILEAHASHPTIFIEAMAFFEMMSSVKVALNFSKHTLYTENALVSWIPTALDYMASPSLHSSSLCLWNPGQFLPSVRVLRTIVYGFCILSDKGVSLTHFSNMKSAVLLLGAIDEVGGQNQFEGSNFLQRLATNRELETMLGGVSIALVELSSCLRGMMTLDQLDAANDQNKMLRWLLMARQVLSPVVNAESGEANEQTAVTQTMVVNAAVSQSISDTLPLGDNISSMRWQARCLVAQLCSESLKCLRTTSKDALVQFNVESAENLCKKQCAQAFTGLIPTSKVVFHLESILSAACKSSTAIMEQAELATLQECGLHFLKEVIECFGRSPDPEQPQDSILNQYTTQIVSAIRHATICPTSTTTSSSRLFAVGCDTMHTALDVKMFNDTAMLKRLVRAMIPEATETPHFLPSESAPPPMSKGNEVAVTSANLLIRVSKLFSTARLASHEDAAVVSVLFDLVEDVTGLAMHMSACAIDGCRLLLEHSVSLAGENMEGRAPWPNVASSPLYTNEAGIDEPVRFLFARSWSTCCACAIRLLLPEEDNEQNEILSNSTSFTWINALVPLLVTGVHDGIRATTSNQEVAFSNSWVKGVDASTVLVDCLTGISCLPCCGDIHEQWTEDFWDLSELLFDSMIIPVLRGDHVLLGSKSLDAFSKFLCTTAKSIVKDDGQRKTRFLARALLPLDMLQRKEIDLATTAHAEHILAMCMKCLGTCVTHGDPTNELLKALLGLIEVSILSQTEPAPASLKEASLQLFSICLLKLPPADQLHVTSRLGTMGAWDSWSVAARALRGNVDFDIVRRSLKSENPIPALVAVRNSELYANVMGDIFELLYRNGTGPNASSRELLSEAMKVTLLASNKLNTEDEATFVNFLTVLFETLLAIIRVNGLPNHPSKGDPELGRISAKTIVHTARTTPAPFKATLLALQDHDRTLLEFAARAEMTGYEVAQAPAKKKLNLAGFKRQTKAAETET